MEFIEMRVSPCQYALSMYCKCYLIFTRNSKSKFSSLVPVWGNDFLSCFNYFSFQVFSFLKNFFHYLIKNLYFSNST